MQCPKCLTRDAHGIRCQRCGFGLVAESVVDQSITVTRAEHESVVRPLTEALARNNDRASQLSDLYQKLMRDHDVLKQQHANLMAAHIALKQAVVLPPESELEVVAQAPSSNPAAACSKCGLENGAYIQHECKVTA